jgi:hypothetical protein
LQIITTVARPGRDDAENWRKIGPTAAKEASQLEADEHVEMARFLAGSALNLREA